MPRYCSVYGCYNNSDKKRDVSYHDFPSNNDQAKAWKMRIRREGFKPSKHSYVCSKHFKPEDVTTPSKDNPLLYQKQKPKQGSISSLFLHGEREAMKNFRATSTAARALQPVELESTPQNEEKPSAASFCTPIEYIMESQDEVTGKKPRN